MKILFYLGHPAHYHLFKNCIRILKNDGINILIVIKSKDVLRELLDNAGYEYYDILPEGKKASKIGLITSMIKRDYRLYYYCKKNRPDTMLGTSSEITHIGKLLNIPSLVFEEDDYEVITTFAKITYPFAKRILAPYCCSVGQWKGKTIFYNSYHEIAYLHPDYYTPNDKILSKLNCKGNDYFVLRFVSLNANHDKGIKGISDQVAGNIIALLEPYGKVFITSERKLDQKFEKYRINLNPAEIIDCLYFARMFVGDSQTMSAEAGILGTPYIRFNDFVGRIGYLEELENKYKVGYGIKTNNSNELFLTIRKILNMNDSKEIWKEKSKRIFAEKIDLTSFIIYLVKNINHHWELPISDYYCKYIEKVS